MARTKTTKRKACVRPPSVCKQKMKDASTQIGATSSTYVRRRADRFYTYEKFYKEIIWDDEYVLQWCMDQRLLAKYRHCPECGLAMQLKKAQDRRDGVVWICRYKLEHSFPPEISITALKRAEKFVIYCESQKEAMVKV